MFGRYLFVARISARQQSAYRSELFFRAISMVLFMVVFIALWSTAYGVTQRESLAGYTLAQIIWYLGMAEAVTLSTSRIFTEISDAVKAGDVAHTLTRPMPYPLFQVANSLGNSAPRFLLNLLTGIVVVALATRSVPGSVPGFLAFLGTAGLALLMDALIAVLIGLLAFWLEEVMPVYLIYQKLLFSVGGLFLPLETFPGWLESAARRLPFQLMAYAPARAFVAFDAQQVARTIGIQLLYVVVLGGLMWGVWLLAQRRLIVQGG
ncbi:MAG: ABC transporter permease [Anaerolineae bacterium]